MVYHRQSAARITRHNIVWRVMQRAKIPAQKEPSGLLRSDNKRSYGVTLKQCKCLAWDLTNWHYQTHKHKPIYLAQLQVQNTPLTRQQYTRLRSITASCKLILFQLRYRQQVCGLWNRQASECLKKCLSETTKRV